MTDFARRSPALWGAVPLFVIGLAGCDMMPPRVWVETERIIELSPTDVEKLAVYTVNGQVNVRPSDDDDPSIIVVAKIKAGGRDEADAQAALEAVEIETPRTGDDSDIQEVRSMWRGDRPSHWQAKVNFDVTMPRKMDLHAESHNGDVDVQGLESKCELSSHNGSVEARDAATELAASSHNGSVTVRTPADQVELSTHNGAVRAVLLSKAPQGTATSHNGKVQVRVQPEASFAFECQVHNGGIDVEGLTTTRIERSRRNASGQVGSDPGDRHLALETHNGQVSLGVIGADDVRVSEAPAGQRERTVVRRRQDATEKEIERRAREMERELDEQPAEAAASSE